MVSENPRLKVFVAATVEIGSIDCPYFPCAIALAFRPSGRAFAVFVTATDREELERTCHRVNSAGAFAGLSLTGAD
jgi:hypothetical protein